MQTENYKKQAIFQCNSKLEFGIANNLEEIKRIQFIRYLAYEELNWRHLLSKADDFYYENELDMKSLVFFVKSNDIVVASCRIMPISLNKDFLAKVSKFNKLIIPEQSTIVERLVVDKSFRNAKLYQYLLASVCNWASYNTSYKFWYAKCSPAHLPIYTKFSAEVLGKASDEIFEECEPREYFYINGEVSTTLNILKEHIISC